LFILLYDDFKIFSFMKESNDFLVNNLIKVFRRILKYWYVLLISAAITIAFAFFYVKHASKTYRVGAAILIRVDGGSQLPQGSDNIMRAFDFILHDKTFQNEIFFIQSYPLIREVVEDMDINVSYYMQEGRIPRRFSFSWKNIYHESPIMVVPTEGHLQPVNFPFYINIIDDKYFYLSATGESVPLIDLQSSRVVGHSPSIKIGGVYSFGSLIENQYASFRVLLNSNYDPGRYKDKDFFFRFNNLDQVASGFKRSLTITGRGIESTMAEIEVKTENVMMGVHFLRALINTYIDRNLEEANMLASKTIQHIDQQLSDVSDELQMSEQQLQNLRRTHNVMNIEEKAQNIYNQLQNFRNQREESRQRLTRLQQLQSYFMENKDSQQILAPSSLGINDPILNNLIQELTTLNSERQRIISQDQLRNPRLNTIETSIDNLKNVIAENIDFSINSAEREISNLDSEIGSLNVEFSSLPQTQRELLGIERRFKLNDATYTSLLERRLQAEIVKASKLPDAKIIEPPAYWGVWRPNRTIILALAFLLGLGGPSVIILLKNLVENKISSREDVEMLTKIPLIATIPTNKDAQQNVVLSYPRTPLAESFHLLRSNLVFYLHGQNKKVILVTSSMPGEGKSFAAINLASSFALANSRTVLVEFDMRKPGKFAEVFGPKKELGVSSYLINKASLSDIISKTKMENLDIISSGKIPPNPVELISSPKTDELISALKEDYDYVIVDTPPFGLLTDSFLLMNYADLKLFITRQGFTKKNLLANNLLDIEKKRISKFFIAINDVPIDIKSYGKYVYLDKQKSRGGFRRKIAAL
jgi:tyrosine-protein kinase Etk/Wzc